MLKRIVLFCSIVIFFNGVSSASQIAGTVRDMKKKIQPMVEVNVKNTGNKTITDSEGKFVLTVSDQIKEVVLVFNKKGYHPVEKRAQVSDRSREFEMLLIPREYLLQRITVTATNEEKEELSVPMAESSVSELEMREKIPENIIEGLSTTPGVHFVGAGGFSVTPSIRGLARRRVLVLVDGLRVTSDRRVGTSASFVLPELSQRIEVIRSASSVLYGSDAIGGVINILTRTSGSLEKPGYEKNSINLSADSINKKISSGITYHQELGNWNLYTGFQYAHAKDYKSPGQTVYHSGYSYYSGLLDISYKDEKRDYYLGYIGGVGKDIGKPDRVNNPNKYSIVPSESDHFIRLGYNEKSLVKKGSLDFTLFLNPATYRLDKVDVKKNTLQHSDTLGSNIGAKAALKKSLNGAFTYQAGIEWYSRQNIRMINKEKTGSKEVITYPMTEGVLNDYGLFLSLDYSGIPTVNIDAGFRYNFFSSKAMVEDAMMEKSSNSPSYFLGVTKKITSSISLFGSIGRAFRFPSLSETFYSGITGRSYVIGNPLLIPESSFNIDAGVKMVSKRLSMGLYLFTYRIDNMIERYLNEDNVYTYENLPLGKIYGGEIEFQYTPVSNLELFGHYLYYRGRSEESSTAVNDVPAPRFLVGSRIYLNRFWMEMNYLHSFEKNDPGPAELKNDAYHLLSVRSGYYFTSMFHIYIRLSNILNETYYPNADPDIPLSKGFEATAGIQLYF